MTPDPPTIHRPSTRRRRLLPALGVVFAILVLQAVPADAVLSQRLRYRFSAVTNPVASVVDDSGKGHTGSASSNGQPGASLTRVSPGADGTGYAISYPAVCPNGTATCPRVVVTTPDSSDLNPGSIDFSFGLRVNVTLAELTSDHGSNLVQKGISTTAQYKLQLDNPTTGRPSCIFRPDSNPASSVRVNSAVGVADGTWHKVTCFRTGTTVEILVDDVVQGSNTLPAGFTITPTSQPFTVGGVGPVLANDQYHGDLDDVYFNWE